jgi:type VI secretion system protein ImpA
MSDSLTQTSTFSDALLAPISTNNGVGEWLRYDPIYVKIRDARREENDGMHRENWEGELKHANWQEVERLSTSTLQTKTKDLQLLTWLLEARLHLYGVANFSQDTALLLTFIRTFWKDLHPQKTEDPDQEFRTNILESFIRLASETILLEPLNELSPIFSQPPNLAKCYEADNLEKTAKSGGAAADTYQKSLTNGLITIDRIRNALSEVNKEKGEAKVFLLEACIQNLKSIDDFVNEAIGNEGPRFDGLISHLEELKGLYCLCKKVPDEKINNETISSTTLALSDEEKTESNKEGDPKKQTIDDRAGVYQAIRQLGEFLLTLEPHSPSPALLKLIGGWENKTLSQILAELKATQPETRSLLELLARATHQENPQLIAANTSLGSTDISQLSNIVPG